MELVYIKAWDELANDNQVTLDSYNSTIITHNNHTGSYNKFTHGDNGGKYLLADVTSDGWCKVNDLWYPSWTFNRPGERAPVETTGFDNDYDAFNAWQNSIDRRKGDAIQRIKESFRRAYPKNYKKEND